MFFWVIILNNEERVGVVHYFEFPLLANIFRLQEAIEADMAVQE